MELLKYECPQSVVIKMMLRYILRFARPQGGGVETGHAVREWLCVSCCCELE